MYHKTLVREEDLVQYLISEYEVSDVRAKELIVRHAAVINDGMKAQSFVYYIGDKIADLAGLEYKEEIELDEYASEKEESES